MLIVSAVLLTLELTHFHSSFHWLRVKAILFKLLPANDRSLDIPYIIPAHKGFPLPGDPHRRNNTMKHAVRMLILVAGLACAFEALAAPIVPAPDGEPPALCNPHRPCPHVK